MSYNDITRGKVSTHGNLTNMMIKSLPTTKFVHMLEFNRYAIDLCSYGLM